MRCKMSTGNPGYSPLPQSNSDSDDSEEELRICHENNFSCRPVDVEVSKSPELKRNVIDYKPLESERHVEETLMKFKSRFEEVIQKSNSSERFSTCRKICFVFSLFLCVFSTIAFIWILPCNIESCPVTKETKDLVPSYSKKDNYTWKKILHNLEIIGPCSLVSDSFGRNQNLVFLARSYLNLTPQSTENFLLSLKGEDGSMNWKVKFETEPTIIDCTLIDIDLDGLNDCLLFDENYITTINSVTGKEIWNSSNLKKEDKLNFLNFPLLLLDVNNDTVKDLLFSYSVVNNSQKNILVVSGKNGEALGEPYEVKFCESLQSLIPSNNNTLVFTCHNSTKKPDGKVSLMDIFRPIRSVLGKNLDFTNWDKVKQYKKPSDTVFLNSFQLVLKNQGHCPEACSFLINIKDKVNGLNNASTYSFNCENVFGMTPVEFKSKYTRGFILKFWKWNREIKKRYFQNNTESAKSGCSKFENGLKHTPKKNRNLMAVKKLYQEMFSGGREEVKRDKRTADVSHGLQNEMGLRLITEILVKVSFNDTHFSLKNLYKDEIIQICHKQYNCFPDVYQQKQSNLVGCFNGDEREKLITFSSGNVIINSKINKSLQMQSKIQMWNCD